MCEVTKLLSLLEGGGASQDFHSQAESGNEINIGYFWTDINFLLEGGGASKDFIDPSLWDR